MEQIRASIYLLSDPGTGAVRYVGKTTTSLRERVSAHLLEARKNVRRSHRNHWLRTLTERPTVTLVEEVNGRLEDINAVECRWIARLRADGCRLTNATDGGEGIVGYRHTPEAKAAMSRARLGKPRPPHVVEALRRANTGKRHSAEARAKMSASQKGLPRLTPEHKAKLKAANTGRKMSPETRETLRVAYAAWRAKRKVA